MGGAEARQLGVEEVLLAAGAHTTPTWRQYFPSGDDPRDIPMSLVVPRRRRVAQPAAPRCVPGPARRRRRGRRDRRAWRLGRAASPRPVAVGAYTVDGTAAELRPSLVVGADGRRSVTRRDARHHVSANGDDYIAGLLLDGLDGVPDDHDVLIGEDDWFFLLFHQGGGRARAYVCTGLSGQHRFAGPEGTARFLEACAVSSYPWSEQVAAATPAGPCATYPGDDTWTPTPYVDGVVLIGDAAGHNDPIIGQGLSIAMRDARIVRDLVLDGARTADAFARYGAERMARMARLRLLAD